MSNLDNLISKILGDCEEKSSQIINSANAKASEILGESVTSAETEKARMLNDAKDEAKRTAEQIILSRKMEIRNDSLNAKQQVIDRVFGLALQKLNDMPKDEYLKFLRWNLLIMDTDGEEIILPSKYNITSTELEELNALLKKNGKNGNLKLYSGDRDIGGGFVLQKGGVENNNTFEALIQYYRYELESAVIEALF